MSFDLLVCQSNLKTMSNRNWRERGRNETLRQSAPNKGGSFSLTGDACSALISSRRPTLLTPTISKFTSKLCHLSAQKSQRLGEEWTWLKFTETDFNVKKLFCGSKKGNKFSIEKFEAFLWANYLRRLHGLGLISVGKSECKTEDAASCKNATLGLLKKNYECQYYFRFVSFTTDISLFFAEI